MRLNKNNITAVAKETDWTKQQLTELLNACRKEGRFIEIRICGIAVRNE